MKTSISDFKRLTWDPAFPLPFESAWSVFAKIIALNNISFSQLKTLVQREEAKGKTFNILDPSDSSWIDFDRFSKLINVDPSRLKTCFWDQLGMYPKIEVRYQVRQCPQCAERGYHCIFFDLSIVATCPWHRCPLTTSCASCLLSTTFSPRNGRGLISARFCAKCGTRIPDVSALLSLERTSAADFRATIAGYCGEFIDWWKILGHKIPARDILLGDILHVGKHERESDCRRSWLVGYACSVMGGSPPWSFLSVSEEVAFASWWNIVDAPELPEDITHIRNEAGKYYRSVRSYIFKRFVKPHRKCFCSLALLSRDDSHELDGSQVCVVSLAFLVWRMSIEGLCNIEGLRIHRKDNFRLRLMGPAYHYKLSALSGIRWSYYGFFGIWKELSHLCESQNIRINISLQRCDGHIRWGNLPQDRQARKNSRTPICSEFHLLYPDAASLVKQAEEKCIKRRYLGKSMLDLRTQFSQQSFSWAQNSNSLRGCLFQIRHCNPLLIRNFFHMAI